LFKREVEIEIDMVHVEQTAHHSRGRHGGSRMLLARDAVQGPESKYYIKFERAPKDQRGLCELNIMAAYAFPSEVRRSVLGPVVCNARRAYETPHLAAGLRSCA
jgi:hypothetical protein